MSANGSLDLSITLPAFESDEWLGIKVNISPNENDTHCVLRIYSDAIWLVAEPSGTVVDKLSMTPLTFGGSDLFSEGFMPLFHVEPSFLPGQIENFESDEVLRIVFANNSITLLRNEDHFHTFVVPSLEYPNNRVIYFVCSSGWSTNPTATLKVSDLDDWREAIYLEMDRVAKSGISSLIQDRPILAIERPDGRLDFYYESESSPYPIADSMIRNYSREDVPPQSASDAMIVGRELTALTYDEYAERFGYMFEEIKLGSLDHGEKKAAQVALRRGLEKAYRHNIMMRPDARIEAGDAISVSPTVTGTGREISAIVIVEKIELSIEGDLGNMNISGRTQL